MAVRTLGAIGAALTLLSAPALAQNGGVYQESSSNPGIVVMEFESTPEYGDWAEETFFDGFTFRSYYRWVGPDYFSTPGNDIIQYRIKVNQAGKWYLKLHNRHENSDSTLENDVWVRMNGGSWFKLYSNGWQTVSQWNWVSRFDIGSNPEANWDLNAGEHLLEFSGRSWGFMIDRMHLHLSGHPDRENVNAPESEAVLGETYCSPAVPNSTGSPAELEVRGSTFEEKEDVTLLANDLPTNRIGYFLAAASQAFVQNPGGSQGNLCLGGQLVRFNKPFQLQFSGDSGIFRLTLGDPLNFFAAGETWNFQAWYRDKNPTLTSNLTDAVSVTFQ